MNRAHPEEILFVDIHKRQPGFTLHARFGCGPETVVLFGPSGAGKSMTLRSIAGLVRPDAGRITLRRDTLFDSDKHVDIRPQERRIGYVPQHFALFPHLTIGENIAFGLTRAGDGERRSTVDNLLELMRLRPWKDRYPREVSGGQQQRAALARALAIEPEVLLMDEPFTALEEELRAHLRQELIRIQATYRLPILIVTHNLADAYMLADRVVVFESGHVLQNGPREVVFRNPASPTVARMIGMTNIMPARVERQGKGLAAKWQELALPLPEAGQFQENDEVILGVRPEEIIVVRDKPPWRPPAEEIRIEATLISDAPQGMDHNLRFAPDPQRPNTNIQVRLPHPIFLRLRLAPGDRRTLAIRTRAIHLFNTEGEEQQENAS